MLVSSIFVNILLPPNRYEVALTLPETVISPPDVSNRRLVSTEDTEDIILKSPLKLPNL